ncbi:MAG: hypothetical protein KJO35_02700, partial [Gammaproteobacteria bacterium]|nr:hypothetical protein [Gammaproteobacteria bacterium]
MGFRLILILWPIMAALPFAAVADDHDEEQPYIYATYMYCDLNGQERADEIVEKHMKKIYDKMFEDGDIRSWGWLAHHTG